MKKIKVLALFLVLSFPMLATNAYATCRCTETVDSNTSVDYAWSDSKGNAVAIVRVKGKQVATYTIAVSDVPCTGVC